MEFRRVLFRSPDQLDLAETRNAVDCQQAVERDIGAGFFLCFAHGAGFRRLAFFQIAGGNGPEASPWFDGPPAQQDMAIMTDHGADHDLRVGVVDPAAIVADHAVAVVALRHLSGKAVILRILHGPSATVLHMQATIIARKTARANHATPSRDANRSEE